MRLKYCLLGLLFFLITTTNAQTKKSVKSVHYHVVTYSFPFNPSLFNAVKNLEYDSVKVFNINCELKDFGPFSGFKRFSVTTDTLSNYLHFYKSQDSLTNGKKLKKEDAARLIYLMKYLHTDKFMNESIGCFFPSMAVAFFKGNKVVANIEYCHISTGMTVRIFRRNKPPYSKYWDVLGGHMIDYFESICAKYQLECCKENRNGRRIY